MNGTVTSYNPLSTPGNPLNNVNVAPILSSNNNTIGIGNLPQQVASPDEFVSGWNQQQLPTTAAPVTKDYTALYIGIGVVLLIIAAIIYYMYNRNN